MTSVVFVFVDVENLRNTTRCDYLVWSILYSHFAAGYLQKVKHLKMMGILVGVCHGHFDA